MNFTLRWINISENIRTGQQPIVRLERPLAGDRRVGDTVMPSPGRAGTFWVPHSPLNQNKIAWRLTTKGDFVNIPVIGYETAAPAKSVLIAMGVEYGMRALLTLARRVIDEVILVVGEEVDEMPGGGWRCYLGMAIRLDLAEKV